VTYGGCWKVLSPIRKETSYSDQTRDLLKILPTKLNTLLSQLLELLQATQKKSSEACPSNQVSAAAITSASDEKWRPFNCFFQSWKQVVVRRGQIRRVNTGSPGRPVSSGLQVPGEPGHCRARTRPLGDLPAAFFLQCPSVAPAEMSNTPCW